MRMCVIGMATRWPPMRTSHISEGDTQRGPQEMTSEGPCRLRGRLIRVLLATGWRPYLLLRPVFSLPTEHTEASVSPGCPACKRCVSERSPDRPRTVPGGDEA